MGTPQTFPKAHKKVGPTQEVVLNERGSRWLAKRLCLPDQCTVQTDQRGAGGRGPASPRQLFCCKGEFPRRRERRCTRAASQNSARSSAPFREEPTGTGARKPTTSSSSQRANHSDTKRQKRSVGATAEAPSPPQSTPLGSTVTEDHLSRS